MNHSGDELNRLAKDMVDAARWLEAENTRLTDSLESARSAVADYRSLSAGLRKELDAARQWSALWKERATFYRREYWGLFHDLLTASGQTEADVLLVAAAEPVALASDEPPFPLAVHP